MCSSDLALSLPPDRENAAGPAGPVASGRSLGHAGPSGVQRPDSGVAQNLQAQKLCSGDGDTKHFRCGEERHHGYAYF